MHQKGPSTPLSIKARAGKAVTFWLTDVSGGPPTNQSTDLDKQDPVCRYSYAKALRTMEQNSVLLKLVFL